MRVWWGKQANFSQQVATSQKRCKTGPRLLLITQRKLHKCFQAVLKSMTLDDLKWPICPLLRNTCVFRAHTKIRMKIRCKLSAAKIQIRDSTFWQYKVYADIQGSTLVRRHQMTVGLHVLHMLLLRAHWHTLMLFTLHTLNQPDHWTVFGHKGRRFW